MRKILAIAMLLLSTSLCCAQTSPNLTYGQVLTPGQWNAIFQSKNDTLGFTPINSAGGVMTGRLVTAPPSSTTAGLNLTCGSVPASPVNGDTWCTSSGLFVQIAGATVGPLIGSASPSSNTIPNLTVTGSFTATGLVTNADLVNTSTTVNGQACALGGSCTITASAGTVTVGTTVVTGGPGVLYNSTSGGTLSAYGTTGTAGFAVLSNSPTIATATLTSPTIATATLSGSVTGTYTLAGTPTITSPTITSPTINGGALSGTFSGAPTLSGSNFISLSNLMQDTTAYSFLGNSSGGTANYAPFTPGGLTSKSSPVSGDLVIIADSAAGGALKQATIGSIASAGSVASIAGNTGAFTLGGGITNSANLIKLDPTSNNTFTTGDQLFGSGRPWCDVRSKGAVGDSATDDTTAIQACVTELMSLYGTGTVYFPPSAGAYCTFTGITVTSGSLGDIYFRGNMRAGALDVCGHNVIALTIGKQFGSVSNLAVYGYGMHSTDTPFGTANQPAVYLTSGASYVTLSQMLIQGGSFPLKVECSGCHINQVTAQYGYGDSSNTRDANAYIDNSGQYWFQSSLDQVLPGATPAYGYVIGNWAASHTYPANSIVNFACGGITWWYQTLAGGISGSGSQPSCKTYGVGLTDNTVTWLLVGSAAHRAVQVDTGSNEVYFDDCDMTGFFAQAFAMTNTLSGAAPTQVGLHHSTPGGSYVQNVYLQYGTNFRMDGGDISNCTSSGCQGAYIPATFTAYAEFNGVTFKNGLGYGVFAAAGPQVLTFTGNFMQSANVAAFYISNNSYTSGIANNCAGSATGLTGTGIGTGSYFPNGTGGNPAC